MLYMYTLYCTSWSHPENNYIFHILPNYALYIFIPYFNEMIFKQLRNKYKSLQIKFTKSCTISILV